MQTRGVNRIELIILLESNPKPTETNKKIHRWMINFWKHRLLTRGFQHCRDYCTDSSSLREPQNPSKRTLYQLSRPQGTLRGEKEGGRPVPREFYRFVGRFCRDLSCLGNCRPHIPMPNKASLRSRCSLLQRAYHVHWGGKLGLD